VDFVGIIKEAGQLVWQNKRWWLLGGLLGIGNMLSSVARLVAALYSFDPFGQLSDWLNELVKGTAVSLTPPEIQMDWLFTTAVSLLLFSLIVWVIATMAEGGLITAVSATKSGNSPSLKQMLQEGRRFLGRFIGIDALVFFPWFLLALFILLGLIALVVSTAVSTTQITPQSAISLFVVGILCLIPLTCLLIPVGFFSFIYRSLSFRDAALNDHTVRQAIRHTWQIVRRNLGNVFILIVIVSGGGGLINQVLNWILIPVVRLTAVPQTDGIFSLLGITAVLLLTTLFLLILLLKAILHTLTAAIWTLAYIQFSE
jgi:hypothetical protein